LQHDLDILLVLKEKDWLEEEFESDGIAVEGRWRWRTI